MRVHAASTSSSVSGTSREPSIFVALGWWASTAPRWTGPSPMASITGSGVPLAADPKTAPIPVRYRLAETQSSDYPERTRLNVADSDATLVRNCGALDVGTAKT